MTKAEGHQDGPSGLFWMTEEAPGSIVSQDMTWKLLEDGCAPVPSFPQV